MNIVMKIKNVLMLDKLTKKQKIYLFTTPLVILLLGLISHDTFINWSIWYVVCSILCYIGK